MVKNKSHGFCCILSGALHMSQECTFYLKDEDLFHLGKKYSKRDLGRPQCFLRMSLPWAPTCPRITALGTAIRVSSAGQFPEVQTSLRTRGKTNIFKKPG